MVYTRNTPALFVIGLIMLSIWWLTSSGNLDPVIEHLATAKKYGNEMSSLPLYFGTVSVVCGLWVWVGRHEEKNADYVGDKFADEARKIHSGEAEERGIYGETTPEEAEELQEEGVPFGRMPWIQNDT